MGPESGEASEAELGMRKSQVREREWEGGAEEDAVGIQLQAAARATTAEQCGSRHRGGTPCLVNFKIL